MATGIIGAAMTPGAGGTPTTGYTAAQVASPTNWNVDANQTVAGQLTKNLDPNSGLIQQARAGAVGQMNDRGLSNSSLAVTAGDTAAYGVALPIAQADAGTYAKSASYNADQQNQANALNVNAQNTAAANTSGAANTYGGQKLQADTAVSTNAASNAAQLAATNINAATSRANTTDQNATQLATTGINAATSRANTQDTNATSIANTGTNAATTLQTANISAETSRANAQLQAQTQITINGLDNQNKVTLQGLQSQNQQLLQTNQSASSMFSSYMQQIQTITNNTTMGADAKAQSIANAINDLKQGLSVAGHLGNADLSQYFNQAGPTGQQTRVVPNSPTNPIPGGGAVGFGAIGENSGFLQGGQGGTN